MEIRENKMQRAYSDPPWFYDVRGFFILTFAYRDTLWRQVAFFEKNMHKEHAELAVGSGTLLSFILRWRARTKKPIISISASDVVPSMLESTRTLSKKYPQVHVVHADATALPYINESFASINMANAIHCIEDIDRALSESYRVLKPGGTFAFNTILYPKNNSLLNTLSKKINAWGIKKGIVFTPYYEDDIRRKLLATGFNIVEATVYGNSLYVLVERPEH